MTDTAARTVAGSLMVVALITLLPGVPSAIRVPAMLAFALVAPGLAASRFLPSVDTFDRAALTAAISMSLVIVVSVALVAIDQWSGSLTFAELVCITTALIAFPEPRQTPTDDDSPVRLRPASVGRQQGPSQMAEVHRRARSTDPIERREGLVELSLVLDAAGESDWAAELRSLARELSQGAGD